MSRFENFIQSLCEVLVNYNEACRKKSKTDQKYGVGNFFVQKHQDLKRIINTLVEESTQKKTRRDTLQFYIQAEINYLNPLRLLEANWRPNDVELLKQQIITFLTNVHQLIHLPQDKTLNLPLNGTNYEVNGLQTGYLSLKNHSRSGTFLSQFFQQTTALDPSLSLTEIKDSLVNYVSNMIDEHMSAIRIAELTKKNSQLQSEITKLEGINQHFISFKERQIANDQSNQTKYRLLHELFEELKNNYENLQTRFSKLNLKIETLESENAKIKQISTQDKSTITTLEREKISLDREIKSLYVIIEKPNTQHSISTQTEEQPECLTTGTQTTPKKKNQFSTNIFKSATYGSLFGLPGLTAQNLLRGDQDSNNVNDSSNAQLEQHQLHH